MSVALHSLKSSLHSQFLTAVYLEVGDLGFGWLGRFVSSRTAAACLPSPSSFFFFFLSTFKSMVKDTKQRAEFSVSVNQQNPYRQINTAKLILTFF